MEDLKLQLDAYEYYLSQCVKLYLQAKKDNELAKMEQYKQKANACRRKINETWELIRSYKDVDVMRPICEYFKVSREEIRSKKRDKELVKARRFYSKIMRDRNPGMSLAAIGQRINKDHCTVLVHIRKLDFFVQHYPEDRQMWEDLKHLAQ